MNSKQLWKLWEDIDGCYIYPANADPDDLCFDRMKPLAKLTDSPEATPLIQYLAKLPAFKPRKNLAQKRISRAMRLQREHEHQSNRDAVKQGSYIKGMWTPKPKPQT